MTNSPSRSSVLPISWVSGVILSGALAACGSSPHDPMIDASHPPDLSVASPPDQSVGLTDMTPPDMTGQVSPPDLMQGATLVTLGDPGFGFRLANAVVGDSLFAIVAKVNGIGSSGFKLVSISKTTGTVTTLINDSNTPAVFPYPQVDPSHLLWAQYASASDTHYVLRVAPLSGVGPSTLLDPATASGVPKDAVLQDFYDSAADGVVYVVLGNSTAAEIGSVPIGGGAYTKIASLNDASDPQGTPMSVSGSGFDFLIRKVSGKLYVGGTATISSTVRHPVVWQVASNVATPVWNGAANTYVQSMTDDGARVVWIEDLSGEISGYDPATSTEGSFGVGIRETFHSAAANGVFYAATSGGTQKRITAYKATLPATFDNSALPTVLATEDFVTTDMAQFGLIPTITLDTDALYFSTNDGIYKVGL